MIYNSKNYFKLYACCLPVQGAARSILCDIQRSTVAFIPEGLYELLTLCDELPVLKIYAKYAQIEESIIDEYFDWLIKNEFGFFTDEPEKFPKIKLEYETPELINNAIIDIDLTSEHDYGDIFTQLDEMGCKFIEIRCYASLSFDKIVKFLTHTKALRFRNIDLLMQYDVDIAEDTEKIGAIFTQFPSISRITFHSSPAKKPSIQLLEGTVLFTTAIIDSEACCGNISAGYFAINIETYLESQVANTCLNKKISIDRFGNIKNCPSMTKSYGNIQERRLGEIATSSDFKKIGLIKKDEINVCKTCEFRYICTDCRAFLPDENILDKPFKCKYDPQTTIWED